MTFYSNRFPITFTLPYIASTVGIDSAEFLKARFPNGLNLSRGNQSTALSLDMTFARSQESQSAVRQLVTDIYTLGWGKTSQNIIASDVYLGYSEAEPIRAFRKMKLALGSKDIFGKGPWDYLLQQLGLETGVDTFIDARSTLDRILIRKGVLDFTSIPGSVIVDAGAILRGVVFDFNVNIPLLEFDIGIDGIELGKARLRNLKLTPQNNGTQGGVTSVAASLLVELRPLATPEVKKRMAEVVKDMQSGGRPRGMMSGSNFIMGASDSDYINIFQMLFGELYAYHLADPGTGLFNSLLGTLDLSDVALGVKGPDSLDISVKVTMNSPLSNIRAQFPYLYIEAYLDSQTLVSFETENVIFVDGTTNANGTVRFPLDRRVEIQKLTDVVTNVLFRRPQKQLPAVTIGSLRFGASKETAITFVDEAIMTFDINRLINSATEYVNTPGQEMELKDIRAVLTREGVSCKITGTRLPPLLPFRSKPGAGGIAKVLWAPNNQIDAVAVEVYFTEIYFVPGEVFWFNLDVRIISSGLVKAYEKVLPRFLQWQPYLQDVLLGQVTLTQGDPRVDSSIKFASFDQITLAAPDLYFYEPLLVQPKLLNPFKQGFGIDLNIFFANPGPLHVEIGDIGLRIYNGNNQLAVVTIPINTINALEGGNTPRGNKIPIQAKLTLNPLFIVGDLLDLLFNRKKFRLEWFADKPGVGAAPWLLDILNATDENLAKNLLPIILSVLRHIELKLGPFTIPLPNEFNDEADAFLNAPAARNKIFWIDD
jgi:hypothetical protein